MNEILTEYGVVRNLTGTPVEIDGVILEPCGVAFSASDIPAPVWELVRDGVPERLYKHLDATPGLWAKDSLGFTHAPVIWLVPDDEFDFSGTSGRLDVWGEREFLALIRDSR